MQTDALIFDLDGTLWDTCETCARAWNRLVTRHGIAFREMQASDVRAVCGMPHVEAIARAFAGLPQAAIDLLAEETQPEDNRAIAEEGGTLYPGLLETIPRLALRVPLFIVSNCQAGYIETFLAFTGLQRHFTDFECWGNTQRAKPDNLAAVIARNGLQRPLFIGDTEGDRDAALKNGVRFVHAAYGFGRVQSADATVAELSELERLI